MVAHQCEEIGRSDFLRPFWGNNIRWESKHFIPAWLPFNELPAPDTPNNFVCLPTTAGFLPLYINDDGIAEGGKIYTMNLQTTSLGFSREVYVIYESLDVNAGDPGTDLNLANATLLSEVGFAHLLPQLILESSVRSALLLIIDADGPNITFGSANNDVFVGSANSDIYFARQGADFVQGGDGNDTLRGQRGSDSLYGQKGDDDLLGEEGNDFLFGGQGNDVLYGGSGDDQLTGGLGLDVLNGMEGNDFLSGGQNIDLLLGGTGNDTLFAGAGGDIPAGENTDSRENWLLGEAGTDVLVGGVDADLLDGGQGDDQMTGGTGADTFVLGGGGVDRVEDFNGVESDRVRASSLLGATSTSQFSFNAITGALFFDASRTDNLPRVQIATLANGATLTPSIHILI